MNGQTILRQLGNDLLERDSECGREDKADSTIWQNTDSEPPSRAAKGARSALKVPQILLGRTS